MSGTTSASGKVTIETHGGLTLPAVPPPDGITIPRAKKKYHLSRERIMRLVREGLVKAGFGDRKKGFGPRRVPLVSNGDL